MHFMNEYYLLKMNLFPKKLIPLGKTAFLTCWSPPPPGGCLQIKDAHSIKSAQDALQTNVLPTHFRLLTH